MTSFSRLFTRHVVLKSCSALQSGGGVFASATCTVDTFDTKFENLTSHANGGALYLEYNSILTTKSSTFEFNSAGKASGYYLDIYHYVY